MLDLASALLAVVLLIVCLLGYFAYARYRSGVETAASFQSLIDQTEDERVSYPWHAWEWPERELYEDALASDEETSATTRKQMLIRRAMRLIPYAREYEEHRISFKSSVDRGFMSSDSPEWSDFFDAGSDVLSSNILFDGCRFRQVLQSEIETVAEEAKKVSEEFGGSVFKEAHKFLAIRAYQRGFVLCVLFSLLIWYHPIRARREGTTGGASACAG